MRRPETIFIIALGVAVIMTTAFLILKVHIENDQMAKLKSSITPSEQVAALSANVPFLFKKLRIGMTKAEVSEFLPKPQNQDDESVWIWVNPTNQQPTSEDYARWENLKILGDGYFIVFKDGKLVSPLCVVSADEPLTFMR